MGGGESIQTFSEVLNHGRLLLLSRFERSLHQIGYFTPLAFWRGEKVTIVVFFFTGGLNCLSHYLGEEGGSQFDLEARKKKWTDDEDYDDGRRRRVFSLHGFFCFSIPSM